MKISGILPIKNGGLFIAKNLPGILASLNSDDQLVVIENGSTDKSLMLLNEFAKVDSRISLLSIGDSGLVKALNRGISESTNPWVARYDIDDSYPVTRLSNQRSLIDVEVSAIFADYEIRSESGRKLGRLFSPLTDIATKSSLINSERTAHPVALLNRDALLEVGGYRQEEFPVEDLGLWTRLSRVGKFLSVPTVELHYRLGKTSISGSNRKRMLQMSNQIKIDNGIAQWAISALKDLEKTREIYRKDENGLARLILHLRDLKHPLVSIGLTASQSSLVSAEIRRTALSYKSFLPSTTLLFEKVRRETYRFTGV